MDDKNTEKLTDKKKIDRKLIFCLVLAVVAIVILLFPNIKQKEESVTAEFSSVDKICELATLRCYYHNVAEYEKQPDGLFQYGLFQYGYKKFWMEYNGIVEVGIDVNEVQINEPDENDVVWIYVPDAEILNVDADENSMSDPITDTGVLTKITSEEKAKAYSEAQDTMRKNAEADSSILTQAKNNAKKLLEQYIINVGEQIGTQYTVEWISKPEPNEQQKGKQS